jgi:choline binding protein I
MRKNKFLTTMIMSFALFAMTLPALASEKIGTVNINIGPGEDDFNAGETRRGLEPTVADNGKYYVEEYSVGESKADTLSPYTYTITLNAQEGYSFSDSTNVEVYGSTSVNVQKRTNKEIKLKAKTYPYHVLANVKKITIDNDKATWEKVPYANKYNVVVYYTNKNGDEKESKKTVSTNNVNLKGITDKYEDVRVSVQAVKGTKDYDKFVSNSDYVFADGTVDDDKSPDVYRFTVPTANSNGTVKTPNATNNETTTNTPSTNNNQNTSTSQNEGWNGSGDNWSYIHNGQLVKGWLGINDSDWYLLDNNGKMQIGWQFVDNGWYLMNPAHDGTYGKMLTGWQEVNGKWYYLNTNHDGNYGRMLSNQRTPDGCFVGEDGAWMK